MKQVLAIAALWFWLSGLSFSAHISMEEVIMSANGTFEVDLTPQEDIGSPAGRMLIKKTYLGDMNGSGTGQMISKRTENGAAVYYAIEEFSGSVKGKNGGFTLFLRVQAVASFKTYLARCLLFRMRMDTNMNLHLSCRPHNKTFKCVLPASWIHRTQLRCAA